MNSNVKFVGFHPKVSHNGLPMDGALLTIPSLDPVTLTVLVMLTGSRVVHRCFSLTLPLSTDQRIHTLSIR